VTFEVLVVCSANVCRSPMAGAILRERFASAGLDDLVRVRTYGENATVGAQMCPDMIARASPKRLPTDALVHHLASQLLPERVEEADLVLTSDRGVRAMVLRDSPAAHPRTFTLRQARDLAAFGRQVIGGHPARDPDTALRAFVAEMNQLRGMTDAPVIERRRLRARPWVKVAVHSHDIPDAHEARGLHSLTAGLLISSTQELARHLTAAAPRSVS
jgi:protein-tyrosine phosphatase